MSGTCSGMRAATIWDEKRGSTFPLRGSGPRGRPAACGSELVTATLSAARLRLTASPLPLLQPKHLHADSFSLVCGGITALASTSAPFSGFSRTFGCQPGVKKAGLNAE